MTFKRIMLILFILLAAAGVIVGLAFVSLPPVEPLKKRS